MNYMESKKKLDELRRGNVKEKMDRCINKAISYVEDLIDLYDSNTEITDIDLCHIIEILKGRE